MPQALFCILSLVFLGYYNTVGNTNGRLDLEGVFDSIGATSREDFTPVKKGKIIEFAKEIREIFCLYHGYFSLASVGVIFECSIKP